ncbi:MAG: tetratricopeptide repeat protein [Proteobacteria bacterium]|nr:tetratricopeptide repeat protein [Pseudomonadota bacterium]
MSDIFREVDEEFQRDKVAQTLKKHGNLIIGVLLLVVLGVGGWRGWQYMEAQKAAEAGKAFETALALVAEGKEAEGKAALEALAKSAPAGYRILAQFRLAAEQAKTDGPGAVKAYEALAADAAIDQTLRDLAKVRAGSLLVDSQPFDALQQRLEPLAGAGQAWRLSAREILGTAAFKAGQMDKAAKYFDSVLADPEVSQSMRQRAEVMMALVRGGPVQDK